MVFHQVFIFIWWLYIKRWPSRTSRRTAWRWATCLKDTFWGTAITEDSDNTRSPGSDGDPEEQKGARGTAGDPEDPANPSGDGSAQEQKEEACHGAAGDPEDVANLLGNGGLLEEAADPAEMKLKLLKDELSDMLAWVDSAAADADVAIDWFFLLSLSKREGALFLSACVFTVLGTFTWFMTATEYAVLLWLKRGLCGNVLTKSHTSMSTQLLLNILLEDIPQVFITFAEGWKEEDNLIAAALNLVTSAFSFAVRVVIFLQSRDQGASIPTKLQSIEEDPEFMDKVFKKEEDAKQTLAQLGHQVSYFQELKKHLKKLTEASERESASAMYESKVNVAAYTYLLTWYQFDAVELCKLFLAHADIQPNEDHINNLEELMQTWKKGHSDARGNGIPSTVLSHVGCRGGLFSVDENRAEQIQDVVSREEGILGVGRFHKPGTEPTSAFHELANLIRLQLVLEQLTGKLHQHHGMRCVSTISSS
ncbi:unnamed protein product [Chrysoparadoxa australica]